MSVWGARKAKIVLAALLRIGWGGEKAEWIAQGVRTSRLGGLRFRIS
jgi:hypothetical protein